MSIHKSAFRLIGLRVMEKIIGLNLIQIQRAYLGE